MMKSDARWRDVMRNTWCVAVVKSGRLSYDEHGREAVLLRRFVVEGLDTKEANNLDSQSVYKALLTCS